MKKPKWHRDFPYKKAMQWYRAMRRALFTAPRPSGTYLRIEPLQPPDTDAETGDFDPKTPQVARLREIFGRRGYGPGWRFSYDKGEDLNLRFVFYEESEGSDVVWWQYHLRAWVENSGVAHVGGHVEPTPEDHPKPHLDGVGFDRGEFLKTAKAILDVEDVPYEEVEWSRKSSEGPDRDEVSLNIDDPTALLRGSQ